MEIEMETKSNGSKTPEVNGEGHETDHESCWWSADCDVKVKNRKIRVSGWFRGIFIALDFEF